VGLGEDSTMITKKLVAVIEKPNQILKFTGRHLISCPNGILTEYTLVSNKIKYLKINGKFIKTND
jgi:hypothetical protein